MKLFAAIVGAAAGFFAGLIASASLIYPGSCIIGFGATIDPFIGAFFGICYGLFGVSALPRIMRSKAVLPEIANRVQGIDTLFGCWIGYHLASGVVIRLEWRGAYEVPIVILWSGTLLSMFAFGALFYWSSGRELKRDLVLETYPSSQPIP